MKMDKMDMSIQFGSHLPALIKVINITTGPVLELGMGMFSTPYLHFACYPTRKLVSYENAAEFADWLNIFKSDYHKVHFVDDWDKIDLSGHWSVVLVDHEPAGRRKEEIKRLANSADYIVVHDTNPRLDRKYRYSEIYPLFKYRKDFNREKPYTAILSNFKDLSQISELSPNIISNSYYSIDNLDKDSLVIDAGGYIGDFTANLSSDCNVIIFEPVPEFFKYCKERFKANSRIKIECLGLGKCDGVNKLYVRKDASSFYEKWKSTGPSDAITANTIQLGRYIEGFPKVDLLKLNIEGTEYDVLEDLAENKQISKIKTILVQFHPIGDFRTRYKISQKILSKTHNKIKGNFKWETWKLKYPLTPLCELALKYGSDKCPPVGHNYTPFYYEFLKDRQLSTKKVLEMGIGLASYRNPYYKVGAGLRMWRDFFPNAHIFGADVARESLFTENRMSTYYCDETNEEDVKQLVSIIGNDIDLVVDDASHHIHDQILLFKTLMPLLNKKVTYIVEDCYRTRQIRKAFPEYDCVVPDLPPNITAERGSLVIFTNKI